MEFPQYAIHEPSHSPELRPQSCGAYLLNVRVHPLVLPALCGEGYDNMEIGDGGTASREFVRVTFQNVPAEERQRIRLHLERYCALDTRAMVTILGALQRHLEHPRTSA